MWSTNMDTSASFQGGFLDNSRSDLQSNDKVQRIQTVVPVMIKHLLSAKEVDEISLWDIPARIFSVVAIIRHIEEATTKISYDVEDESGTITALKWLESDKKISGPVIEVNSYVRIFGLFREQNEKRHILILKMYPIENLNEITNHLLEVTYATLKAEAMAKKNKEPKEAVNPDSMDGAGKDSLYYGMTADQTLVYKIIREENHVESGIERSDIKGKVPAKILPKINDILDFLVSEGHIYTTSTDDHFRTT